MTNNRLSRSLCTIVGNFIKGSHSSLEALFKSSGAPGDPPDLAHHSKWKEWLFRTGQDSTVDSLMVLGNILEEFMDIEPEDTDSQLKWNLERKKVINALNVDGLQYFRGGRVLPIEIQSDRISTIPNLKVNNLKPNNIDELLNTLIKGLPRAIYPLSHRRKNANTLNFNSEYDIQDLLHSLLRPWVTDIRPEEFTPSYACSSTRMDFLLPKYSLVIETKLARDYKHAKEIGNELIIDIDHYRVHPDCNNLYCVIYDPNKFIQNSAGLTNDLEGVSSNAKGSVSVRVYVI